MLSPSPSSHKNRWQIIRASFSLVNQSGEDAALAFALRFNLSAAASGTGTSVFERQKSDRFPHKKMGIKADCLPAARKGISEQQESSRRHPDICSVKYLNIEIEVTTSRLLLFASLAHVWAPQRLPSFPISVARMRWLKLTGYSEECGWLVGIWVVSRPWCGITLEKNT